jgi:arginine decarboxylase
MNKLDKSTLNDNIEKHIKTEKSSFHTPGHKGYTWQQDGSLLLDAYLTRDLTELPGLDELAYPTGVLADLEKQAADIWQAKATLISVNGATAGIIASILLLAKHGDYLLVPRNCHRSVIHALVLTGLKPIWFEPIWQDEWGVWGPPDIEQIKALLDKESSIAGLIITSPTYAGALADIKSFANLLHRNRIPLIVDEAHGAHLLWTTQKEHAAVLAGADLVIHSLHKTLTGLTQTGLVSISNKGAAEFGFSVDELRRFLTLIQSSSPSYLFMASIANLINAFSNGYAPKEIQRMENLGKKLKLSLKEKADLEVYESPYGTSNVDVLVRYKTDFEHKNYSVQALQVHLINHGIFPETILGNGLLFLLGIGSKEKDVDYLLKAFDTFASDAKYSDDHNNKDKPNGQQKPSAIDQVITPKDAFYMPSRVMTVQEAIGEISAECLAPCPPGWPILVPGQRITDEILHMQHIDSIRVVIPQAGHYPSDH